MMLVSTWPLPTVGKNTNQPPMRLSAADILRILRTSEPPQHAMNRVGERSSQTMTARPEVLVSKKLAAGAIGGL
jgi:hypothetical protein